MRGAGRVNVWCLSAADLPKLLYRQFPIIGTGYRGLEIATDAIIGFAEFFVSFGMIC